MHALTLALLLAADGGISAKELNVEGYELYKAQKWQEAADRFRDAFVADPKLAIAHYNFASTVFRALQENGCGGVSYELGEAIEHLRTSIRLDPKRLARLKEDPDFSAFRFTARYFELLGTNLGTAEGLTAIFPRLRFTAPTWSDMGPSYRVQFLEGGVVTVSDRIDRDGEFAWDVRTGRWRVKKTSAGLTVEIDVPASKHVPAVKYRGLVELGPAHLSLKAEQSFFASDEWAECCC